MYEIAKWIQTCNGFTLTKMAAKTSSLIDHQNETNAKRSYYVSRTSI